MVNYRVHGLDAPLKALRVEGCTVFDKTDDSEFGCVIDRKATRSNSGSHR